ncbi:MAG: hypothetical protein K2L07_05740 [Lachnospiraceae bacterium]|nr:hypothetical protein [Lachnospiraceae bacterium]
MAKFQINRKSLIHDANRDFALTRVPNSNAEYYLLIGKEDVVSADENTIVVEWADDKQLDIIPAIREEGKDWRPPTLKEAVEERLHPSEKLIQMTAGQLESNYYHYDDDYDPEEKARIKAEREQLREEAKAKKEVRQSETKRAVKSNRQEFAQDKATNQTERKHQEKQQKQEPADESKQEAPKQHFYNKQQFHEIKMGVRRGLDTSLYSNIHFNADQMRELRLAMQQGVDIKSYNNPLISAEHMKELRLGAENGVALDLSKLDQTLYNAEQIHELRIGFEKGLNVKDYMDPEFSAAQMKEIRLGQQVGLNTSTYANIHYTPDQMATVRHQLVFQHLKDIFKKWLQDVRAWAGEKISTMTEKLVARTENRAVRSSEELQEARMREAVQDVKTTLINSELLPEEAYEDKELDENIKTKLEELVEDYRNKPDNLDRQVAKKVKEVCEEAGAKLDMNQENLIYVKSTEEAIEEVMNEQEQFEQLQEMMYEQIDMEMMM